MTLLFAFTVALCTSLLLTPMARAVAQKFGVVDRPDGQRKLQSAPVALWGGVAVYCGLCAGLAAAIIIRGPGQPIPARLSLLIVISGGLLGLAGLIDDTHSLRARTKLLMQILAVSPVVLAGFYPQQVIVLGTVWELGWMGPAFMVFWLVACVNAINLLDGLDGFASVVGITIAIVIAGVGLLAGNFAASVASVALAGAILGFLPFNLPPASIYLGDAGSMLIGLSLGALSMQATDITNETFVAVVPLAIMAVPLWDTSMAVLRRRLRGIPIGEGDRDHLHHRLVARGLSNVQALFFVALLCLAGGGAVLLAVRAEWELLALLGAATIICLLVATRVFGEDELGLLRRATAAWTVATAAPLALPMRHQGVKLKRALKRLDFDGAWQLLTTIADQLNCNTAELSLSEGSPFRSRTHRVRPSSNESVAPDSQQSSIAVHVKTKGGIHCEVRATLSRKGVQNALYAACLADVLSLFAEHFLLLATAESSPVLHVIADEEGHREKSRTRRAA